MTGTAAPAQAAINPQVGLTLSRLTINLACDYGLTKVFKEDDEDEVKNRILSLTVGLLLD